MRGRLRPQSSVQIVERLVELRGLLVAVAVLNIMLLVLAALCVACLLQLPHLWRLLALHHQRIRPGLTLVGLVSPLHRL